MADEVGELIEGNRVAQLSLMDAKIDQSIVFKVGCNAASAGLYFRQLWHGLALSSIEALILAENKKPATRAGLLIESCHRLLDFGFFVNHMLTRDGIVFFDFHFTGHVFFVFCGGVVVAIAF
jgi:hypothetical protein